MDIYVGNLNFDIQEEQIFKLFGIFGPVEKVTLLTDRTGKSKGKAFVKMSDAKQAFEAIKELDGRSIAGRYLVVSKANGGDDNLQSKPALQDGRFNDELTKPHSIKQASLAEPPEKTITNDGYVKIKFSK